MKSSDIKYMWDEINFVFGEGMNKFDFYAPEGRTWVEPSSSDPATRRFLRAVAHPDVFDENGDRRLQINQCSGCTTNACKKKYCNGGGRRRLETGSAIASGAEGRGVMENELNKMLSGLTNPNGRPLKYPYSFKVEKEGK